MSGSPKYTYGQLRQMELEEERRRRRAEAEAEAERRRAEAERLAVLGRDRARADVARAAAVVTTELAALSVAPLCEYISAAVVAELQAAARKAAADGAEAPDEGTGRAAGRTLQQLLDRIRRHTAEATHTHLQREAGLAALTKAEEAVRAAAAGPAGSFLPDGFAAGLSARLGRLRERLTETRAAAAVRACGEELAAARGELTRAAARAADLQRRDADLKERKAQAEAAADGAGEELAAFRADATRAKYVTADLTALDAALRSLRADIQAGRFDEAVVAARRLTDEVRRVAARAGECHVLAEETATARTTARDAQPPGRQFDRRGAAELARLLDAADAALRRGAAADARDALGKVPERLDRHARAVAAELAVWQANADAAEAAVAQAERRAAELRAAEVAARWCAPALPALDRQLAAARAALDTDRFTDARATAAAAEAEVARLFAAAEPLEVQARVQQRLVGGVTRVMGELGYQVGPPLAERPDDPRSALTIQAGRPAGERIAVTVEHEGRIEYDIGGTLTKHERVVRVGHIDRKESDCPEGEAQLLQLHALLRELGIETSGLHWDEKGDGPPGLAAARDLPHAYHRPHTEAAQRPNPQG